MAERRIGEGAAPQSVTVEDVQRILAEDKGKPDVEVARQLSGLELKKRMSDARLNSLEQSVPGTKSWWALLALADASVFLSPAAADVLPQAPPDLNEQQHVIDLTVEYLAKTLPKLPDRYATRTTVRYDNGRSMKRARAKSQDDSSSHDKFVVAHSGQLEGGRRVPQREGGCRSSRMGRASFASGRRGPDHQGTFGPILSTVIADAARGEMTWDRWERGDAGTLAVFRYRVPENQSHYSLAFHGLSSDRGGANQGAGYYGEVAIDPAAGTILRLTVQADLALDSPILSGDIMVEYGPIEIGGKPYTCPIRSVSISLDDNPFARRVTNLLNDVIFADYHLFRAESRILTGNIPAPDH